MTTSYCLMVTRFILIVTLVSFLNNQRSNPSMESGPFGYTWTCQEQEDTTRRGFLDNGIVPLPPLLLLPLLLLHFLFITQFVYNREPFVLSTSTNSSFQTCIDCRRNLLINQPYIRTRPIRRIHTILSCCCLKTTAYKLHIREC